MDLPRLQKQLGKHFSLNEIRDLCLDMRIEYEEIPGETRNDKARELILYCERRNQIDNLGLFLRDLRPNVKWDVPFVLGEKHEDEARLLIRVKRIWINKLKQEVPENFWLDVEKSLNGVPQQGEIAEILGSDLAAIVIGEHGSGKTIALCKLALTLIEDEATQNQRLPVILNVASWPLDEERKGDKRHFEDWFKQAFAKRYSSSETLGETWLANDRFYLLLDGVDQIDPEYRQAFVDAVNDYFYKGDGWANVIITCRTDVLKSLDTKFKAPYTIELHSLDSNHSTLDFRQKITPYLSHLELTDPSLQGLSAWFEANEEILEKFNSQLSPLMLRLMIEVYRKYPNKKLKITGDDGLEEGLYLLSESYVDSQFEDVSKEAQSKGEKAEYDTDKARHWLTWLARKKASGTFHVENMQPAWLPGDKVFAYRAWMTLITGSIIGLPSGLVLGLGFHFGSPNEISLVRGILIGLLCGFIVFGLGVAAAYFFLPDGWKSEFGIVLATFLFPVSVFSLAWDNIFTGIVAGLIMGIAAFLVARVTGILNDKHKIVVETFSLSWLDAAKRAGKILVPGLLLGLVLERLIDGTGWFELIAFSALFGSVIAFASGLKTEIKWEKMIDPNEGILRALRNAIASGTITGGASGLIAVLIGYRSYYQYGYTFTFDLWGTPIEMPAMLFDPISLWVGSYELALFAGVFIGSILFLTNGGWTVLKHYVLRSQFAKAGCIPTGGYTHFLDYANHRLNLLLKMGTGYEFDSRSESYFSSCSFTED